MGALHLRDRALVRCLLRVAHELAFKQPDEGVEPEQGGGNARRHQRRPVSPNNVRDFMRQDRIGIFGALVRVCVDQNDGRSPAPAQRRRYFRRNAERQGRKAGRRALPQKCPRPLGARHRLCGRGPAAQRPKARYELQPRHQQPTEIDDQDQRGGIVEAAARRRYRSRETRHHCWRAFGNGHHFDAHRLGLGGSQCELHLQRRQHHRNQGQEQEQADADLQHRRPVRRRARSQHYRQQQGDPRDQSRFPTHFNKEGCAHD